MNRELFSQLVIAEKNFKGTKYSTLVEQAAAAYDNNNISTVKRCLSLLPTVESLLVTLTKKLEGKPVYRTLEAISEKKLKEGDKFLKGLFSLGTHTIIEMEKGNLEYKLLLNFIYEKIGIELFK